MPTPVPPLGQAWFAAGPSGGTLADRISAFSNDPADLERGGWWAVLATFEGSLALWRCDRVRPAPLPGIASAWTGMSGRSWRSSLGRHDYLAAVAEIRARIRSGEVYQANLCRTLRTPVAPGASPWDLAAVLAIGNPAPYAAVLDVPGGPAPGIALASRGGPGRGPGAGRVRLVSASPELFLRRAGDRIASSPIKGTGVTAADLRPKDEAENVMIVDLMRNDLQRVCRPGSVEVSSLLAVEHHPGLVHLVSTVEGVLRAGTGWSELLSATLPPGSVSGAPKSSALRAIGELEPVPRGPYCGAVGWIDADRDLACLAVGIRTFWWDGEDLCFGTGAGITWGSDPQQEWAETELKAGRLISLATGSTPGVARAADQAPAYPPA